MVKSDFEDHIQTFVDLYDYEVDVLSDGFDGRPITTQVYLTLAHAKNGNYIEITITKYTTTCSITWFILKTNYIRAVTSRTALNVPAL